MATLMNVQNAKEDCFRAKRGKKEHVRGFEFDFLFCPLCHTSLFFVSKTGIDIADGQT